MSIADERTALHYYNGFRKLVLLRRETITLERMAQLINDMAEASVGWVKVTPEQLRDLEADRYHGVSLIAVMYARFLGHNSIAKVAMMYGTKTFQEVQQKADQTLFNLRIG